MKRIVALCSAIVITFMTVAAPVAKADLIVDYSNSSLAQWALNGILVSAGTGVGTLLGNAVAGGIAGEALALGINDLADWYAAGHTDQEIYDAESAYVSDLETGLGTCTVINGGIRIWYDINANPYLNQQTTLVSYTRSASLKRAYVSFKDNRSIAWSVLVGVPEIKAPFACTYSQGYVATYDNCRLSEFTCKTNQVLTKGQNLCSAGFCVVSDNYNQFSSFTVSIYVDLYPAPGVSSGAPTRHTRPTVLRGSYRAPDDEVYVNPTIFDEEAMTYHNPITDMTYDVTDWAYDYATRTYELTLADGTTATVCYGDTYLTLTDHGETYTLYYYIPAPGGGGGSGGGGYGGGTLDPGETGSGESLIDKIKDGLVGALSALIEGTLALVKTVLEGTLGLVTDLIGSLFSFLTDTVLGGLSNLFSSFGDSGGLFDGFAADGGGYALPESEGVAGAFLFISGLFGILPDPLRIVFLFGLGAILFFAIVKKVGE